MAYDSLAASFSHTKLSSYVGNDVNFCHMNFQVLGSGFEVISIGKRKLVRSVPTELNKDHNEILEVAQVCFASIKLLLLKTSWYILTIFSI